MTPAMSWPEAGAPDKDTVEHANLTRFDLVGRHRPR